MLELTNHKKKINGKTYYQIRNVAPIDNYATTKGVVPLGVRGGWVQSLNQIAQTSWIAPDIILSDGASVGDYCLISAREEDTIVYDHHFMDYRREHVLTKTSYPKRKKETKQDPIWPDLADENGIMPYRQPDSKPIRRKKRWRNIITTGLILAFLYILIQEIWKFIH